MKNISDLFKRAINGALVVALIGVPEMSLAQSPSVSEQKSESAESTRQLSTSNSTPAEAAPPAQSQSSELPNSPGAVQAQPARSGSTERPLGTAAAEIGNASGTPASKPAGVAIAPAKQRQSRSLLIKLGAVIGVGVAVGTVLALSSASPSRPPGSQ